MLPVALRSGVGRTDAGRAWLTELADLVTAARRRWGLHLGDPYVSGSASWCAPARDQDGRDLVLKISFPHDEAQHEAAVLRAWNGHGAARLVDSADGDWALLLERIRPGTPMRAHRSPVRQRLTEAGLVARELAAAPVPVQVPDLAEVGARWAELIRHRAEAASDLLDVDPGLVRMATDVLGSVRSGGGVLHGDLNPGNLLRSGDGRWVAIDPKAMRGPLAYDLWPLLEQVGDPFRAPDPVRTLAERTRVLADAAGVPAEEAARWALARGVEAGLWDIAVAGSRRGARARLGTAALWAQVIDRL